MAAHVGAGEELSDKTLLDVAKKIGGKWDFVAVWLTPKLEEHEIDNIKANFTRVQDQAFEMLKMWRRNDHKAATRTNLCVALLEEKLKKIASETFGDDFVERVDKLLSQKREEIEKRGQDDKRVFDLENEPFFQDMHRGYFVRHQNQKKRLVAVRKAPLNDKRMSNEMDILESRKCDNLIGFIDVVTIDTVWHCCLQYCEYSVEQYVLKKDDAYKTLKGVIYEIDIVRGVASGLDDLHSREKPITHINLAPAGVRIMVDENGKVEAKICDISTSPRLYEHAIAMEGFINPSPDVDVFSFGCFAYYVITNGKHPFSEPGSVSSELSEIQSRIDSGKFEPNFEALEDLVNKSVELKVKEDKIRRIGNPAAALALVKSTLSEGKKPSSCCIKSHCYFFKPGRQVEFHWDFGGTTPFYEGEKTDNEDMDSLLDELSRHDEDVVGWKGRLENLGAKKEFLSKQLVRHKKCGDNVQSFSKFLRNQFSHKQNRDEIREFFESDEKSALLLNRGFPKLLPVCWEISKKLLLLQKQHDLSKYHCEKHFS
ncbi:serine/threonine-protein kinase/endoribonuclease IRE1-like [Oscarella lobularis]|uniref:serine/threonine-protein kinase/endoribonuclease IRE1-like n=1 Tax=Oscarella lobularis TaxID=121494 RepID=UPI003313338E